MRIERVAQHPASVAHSAGHTWTDLVGALRGSMMANSGHRLQKKLENHTWH
jgi:hypothetical protein